MRRRRYKRRDAVIFPSQGRGPVITLTAENLRRAAEILDRTPTSPNFPPAYCPQIDGLAPALILTVDGADRERMLIARGSGVTEPLSAAEIERLSSRLQAYSRARYEDAL